MDFLKKARSQVKSAVKDIQSAAQQTHQQYYGSQAQSQSSPQLYQQQGSGSYQPQNYQAQHQPAHPQHYQPFQQQQYTQPQYQGYQYSQQPQYAQPPPQTQYHCPPQVPTSSHQQHPLPYHSAQPLPPAPHQPQGHVLLASREHQPPPSREQPISHTQPSQANVPQLQLTREPKTYSCAAIESELTDYIQFFTFAPNLLSSPGRPDLIPDEFAVCSSCFHSTISPYSQLASCFHALEKEKKDLVYGEPAVSYRELYCAMHLPRVRMTFYRHCIPQQSILPLLDYTHMAKNLASCDGSVITEPVDYYEPRYLPSSAICTSCYEKYIAYTPFQHGFQKQGPRENYHWICDIGTKGYFHRKLLAELGDVSPDFNRFVATVKPRFEIPNCPEEGNVFALRESGPAFVYSATDGRCGNFCQACWYDHVAGTVMEKEFANYSELTEDQKGTLPCDISSAYSKFAMKAAIRVADVDVWRKPVVQRQTLPPCVGLRGIDEEELRGQEDAPSWYCFTEYPSIEICPFCYVVTAELMGAASLFSPIDRPLQDGVIRMCYMAVTKHQDASVEDSDNFENTLVWRGKMIRNTLSHGWHSRGNFVATKYIAKVIADLPPPCGGKERGFKESSGRKWLGKYAGDENDFTFAFCEECYAYYIKDTQLHDLLSNDMDAATHSHVDGFHCTSYSKRAKQELSDACKKGDWAHFVDYWRRRNEVRLRWMRMDVRRKEQTERQKLQLAIIDAQNSMAYMQLMNQLTANTNATIMSIGGSVAEAAATDNGQRYGNATVGYGYLTASGASAAQAHHDAAKIAAMTDVNQFTSSGDTLADTKALLIICQKIEDEWAAIE